jgi:deoxyribonuclease-4
MSIAGGVDRALVVGKELGCEVVQIYTKSSSQWAARGLRDDEVTAFRAGMRTLGIPLVAAHDSYLINLCSPDEALWRRSVEAFGHELERCQRLGIKYLIAHPGSHRGAGAQEGIRRIVAALDEILSRGSRVTVLLETTAGQGTSVGHRFEHFAEILGRARERGRVGVCFDTCHAHAAGYELRTAEGYHRTFEEFDRLVGIGRIKAFHLNDCRRPLGSRVDRHWHIGRGFLGLEPFRLILNDPRFDGLPGFLETPKGEDCTEDRVNLRALRKLAGDPAPRKVPSRMKALASRKIERRRAPGRGRGTAARVRPARRRAG